MDFKAYKFSDVKDQIHEGDILLFRGRGIFSKIVQRCTNSVYSHIGAASWVSGVLECVEFREFKGGRSVNLETQLRCDIDVYRISNYVDLINVYYDENGPHPYLVRVKYNGLEMTNRMRILTGLDYNWKYIWTIVRTKIPLLRLIQPINTSDSNDGEKVLQICSSALAECLQSTFIDLFPHCPNALITPSDFARCPLLNYIFTIGKVK